MKTNTKNTTLNEYEVRTVLAVFEELRKLPFSELNKHLGSITIEEMCNLDSKLSQWYKQEVLGYVYDEELGWHDPNMEF